jgi:DNA-binding response OmpR family regulator
MSGYPDGAIAHHGILDAGVAYLPKPFTTDAVARRVREILDDNAAKEPNKHRKDR